MPISPKTYERIVLEDPDHQWELHCGQLVEKPPMTWEHNFTARRLADDLGAQLDRGVYEAVYNIGRVSRARESYFIPDVYVIPRETQRRLFRRGRMESYPTPLPLVVEVWSRSTGGYDNSTKLPEYRRRGDLEIWFIHPYERTLRAWQRQPDGTYTETLYTEGSIQPVALPGVTIEIATLFEWE
ncbi:MAG: Uma2 family endonuclease [Dehalococcoidia bacterium]